MKRILSILLATTLIFTVVGTAFATENGTQTENKIVFSDVNDNTPGAEAIKKLANAGIINGYGDGTFGPNNFLTRAELTKIVNLVYGYTEPAEENFWDVAESDWYYKQVLIAKKSGYIVGFEDGSFGGERPLTREEVCVVINRCVELMTLDTGITISDEVSDWAVEAVNKVVSNLLMPLGANNTFRATENITRAELAQVVSYFVKEETPKPTTDPATKPDTSSGSSDSSSSSSSSSGGSTGSTGGGGGGGGGGTSSSKPDNKEVVKNLNKIVSEVNSISGLTSTEKAVLSPVVTGINKALAKADKVKITTEYIEVLCKNEIKEAKDAYYSMDKDQQDSFVSKIVNDVDTDTLQFLINFFMPDADIDLDSK